MRTAARTDDNQTEIVEAFRSLGASVVVTSGVGKGFPDLVIGAHGKTALVECKDESKPPSKRKLTPDQQDFHRDFKGMVAVVQSPFEAYELMRLMSI